MSAKNVSTTTNLKLNSYAEWTECPGHIPIQKSLIRGISPCREYVLLQWLANPIHVSELKPCQKRSRSLVCIPVKENQWKGSIDISTGHDLSRWTKPKEIKPTNPVISRKRRVRPTSGN